MKKKIIYLYDFAINHTNRGCQALTYGSISFISQIIDNTNDYEWLVPAYCFRKREDEVYNIEIEGHEVEIKRRYYFLPEIIISSLFYRIFKGALALNRFTKDMKRLEYVTNISGGDGFSDIYSKLTFFILLWPSIVAVFLKKKLIIMPQTIGPFKNKYIKKIAHYIIKGAYRVYVRDYVYAEEMDKMGIKYTQTFDVSYYMPPKSVEYNVNENSVGINISGLTYYNHYRNLSGMFDHYKKLIIDIIKLFQDKNVSVYLVPHTYNYEIPEIDSDDLQASKDLYNELIDKTGVYIVDLNMIAPEIKYIISKFDFFIGTRMHANFAAIYTKTPVYGLAYSYKFSGSFNLYGLKNNYSSVININHDDIEGIIEKIDIAYLNRNKLKFEF